MLNLVMNTMIGLIAATTLASLLHSVLAFMPAFHRLRAEVNHAGAMQETRVTLRDTSPLGHGALNSGVTPPALAGYGAAA